MTHMVKIKSLQINMNFNMIYYQMSNAELLEKIGAYGEKQMYGNTYMGTMRKSYIVDEKHKVRKIFNKVKTATHGDELLNEINQLDL